MSFTDDDVSLIETFVVASIEYASIECNQNSSVNGFENGHVVPGCKNIKKKNIKNVGS